MPSNFDNLQRAVFDTALSHFGFDASWQSVDGLASYEGKVLYRFPSEEYKAAGIPFSTNEYYIEYREGQFEGLLERVERRASSTAERVTVEGETFIVREVLHFRDGRTYRAYLTPEYD